jgi:hypothetical protein
MPTAAGQIWPHLKQATPSEVEQRRQPSLGDAMWPQLSREAKAKERDQALWDAICERNRRALVRGLREAVASVRADKQGGVDVIL